MSKHRKNGNKGLSAQAKRRKKKGFQIKRNKREKKKKESVNKVD